MTDAANLVRREAEFLLYIAPDGAVKVRVLFKDETAWLTQKALAELFGVGVPAINEHLTNIFESQELSGSATISKMEIVQPEGGRKVAREFGPNIWMGAGVEDGYRNRIAGLRFTDAQTPRPFAAGAVTGRASVKQTPDVD